MKTVWKFQFQIMAYFTLDLPLDARILTAFVQTPNPEHEGKRYACLWAEVDPEANRYERRFLVIGTGDPLPKEVCKWIATFPDPPLIFHLYEVYR